MARQRVLTGLGISVALGLVIGGCASGPGGPSPTAQAPPPSGAINAQCPTSGIPINPEVPTADYAGHEIGFCSSRCEAAWNTWSKAKRDAFVARNK